tara:strand:- start:1598 stop:1762 length:165 start_codon:yes stop_codon:yes gene_type:complete
MGSVIPQILASSAIMTFVMMHADFLQAMLLIFLSALALAILGIPSAEFSFNYFF